MLADREWHTPHDWPGGMSVAEWVREVRWLEANGLLADRAGFAWPADPDHPANRARRRDDMLCPPLCWRPRCQRIGRCRHLLPLAIREFMPELSVHLSALAGEPSPYDGPVDAAKMMILAEIFPAVTAGDEI